MAGLAAGETGVDDLGVGSGDLGLLTEATLTLGGLLAQDVALESLGAHKLEMCIRDSIKPSLTPMRVIIAQIH